MTNYSDTPLCDKYEEDLHTNSDLSIHIKDNNEGTIFKCLKCDYINEHLKNNRDHFGNLNGKTKEHELYTILEISVEIKEKIKKTSTYF